MADVGKGMLVASVGSAVALDLGLSRAFASDDSPAALMFGEWEPLVALLQETPADKLMPLLVAKIHSGTPLRTLITAAALANARTFGGHDYIGFHTFMALAPALKMANDLPSDRAPLPVLKVIYRNAQRIQDFGGRASEVLHVVDAGGYELHDHDDDVLVQAIHQADLTTAEKAFAAQVKQSPGEAFNHLQFAVQDEVDVHRVVLAWRAWSTLDLTGLEHAQTMLRQSLHYCLNVERSNKEKGRAGSPIRALLPKLLDQYNLLEKRLAANDTKQTNNAKQADDAWIEKLATLIANSSPEQAADAMAAALGEGFSQADLGEALSLAANQLVLRDPGRPQQWSNADKPAGSVHGDSVGVHASDAANAWRNIAAASNPRNALASLIVGAYHTAGQAGRLKSEFYPTAEQLATVTATAPDVLLGDLEAAIMEKDQFRACAVVQRYGAQGHAPRAVMDVLLRYGVSEDGALHAEKYYHTVSEEFARTREAFRWRQLTALARVTASEYGKPAPGYATVCELLKV